MKPVKVKIKWFSIEDLQIPDDMDPASPEAREYIWTRQIPFEPKWPKVLQVDILEEDD